MSANRKGVRRPVIGLWSENIGYLLAHKVADGGGCWVRCGKCNTWDEVDLAGLVIKRGPLLSLWNRSPRCPKCGGRLSFHAHHAPNARVIPLQTDEADYTDEIHKRYEMDRRRRLRIRIPPEW
jgi:hypothetical protein